MMRTTYFAGLAILVATSTPTTYAQSADEEPQCYTSIGDPDAPFKSVGPMIVKQSNPNFSDEQIAPAVPSTMNFASYLLKVTMASYGIPAPMVTSFETCLASSDGLALVSNTLLGSLATCSPVLDLTKLDEVKNLQANLPTSPYDVPKLQTFLAFLLQTEDTKYQNICTPVIGTVLPCIKKIIPSVLGQLKVNSCCDPLFAQLRAIVGMEPAIFVEELATNLFELICAIRTPGFNGNKEQTCGYTLLHTLLGNPDPMVSVSNIINSVIIPDSEVCKAYSGEKYVNVDGNGAISNNTIPGLIGNAAEGIAIEGCAAPIESLVVFLSKIPLMALDPLISQVFTPGQCLKGMDFMTSSYGQGLFSLLPSGVVSGFAQQALGEMCFNLPSEFTCAFASSVTKPTGKEKIESEELIKQDPVDDDKTAGAVVAGSSTLLMMLSAIILAIVN